MKVTNPMISNRDELRARVDWIRDRLVVIQDELVAAKKSKVGSTMSQHDGRLPTQAIDRAR